MTLTNILEGVEAALTAQWPAAPVYQNRTPKNFTRPAFLLEGGPVSQEELGGSMEQFSARLRVTAFLPVDAYKNSDAAALAVRMSEMMALFAGGYVQIGERCPHVTALTGDYGFDYAEVSVALTWREAWEIGEDYPLMRDIHLSTN